VDKMSDKYYIYDRANFNRKGERKQLAPGTAPERVGMSLSTDTYSVNVYGLAHAFDFQTLANEDAALNLRSGAANMLQMLNLIDRENDWMSTYFTTGVWDTEYTGVANADNDTATEFTQWDDYTNSTPIIDVRNIKRAAHLASGGFKPNVMVVTQDVHDILLDHPDVLDRIDGGATTVNPALASEARLAQILVSCYPCSREHCRRRCNRVQCLHCIQEGCPLLPSPGTRPHGSCRWLQLCLGCSG